MDPLEPFSPAGPGRPCKPVSPDKQNTWIRRLKHASLTIVQKQVNSQGCADLADLWDLCHQLHLKYAIN